MPPVAAFLGAVGSAIGATISAVAAWQIGGFAVGQLLLTTGLNLAFSKLLAPKAPAAAVAQRQASVLTLALGETPREAVFGRAVTAGTLLDAFNWGSENEWEVNVIALADHECDALEGFYIDDRYYTFPGNGWATEVTYDGAFWDEGQPQFVAEFWTGSPGQFASDTLISFSVASGEPEQWSSADVLTNVAYVIVGYRVNDKVFPSGRPKFKFQLRGAKCYDPRKDSTVTGGSGSHRWGNLATYEWSENAAVCAYQFKRGIWSANGQLLLGPGKSAEEAPPADEFARMNTCDEDVGLKAGGTEKRYRVGCVVRSDEAWIDVEEDFAAAMAGELVERAGVIAIDPGAAKSAVFAFTDDDLLNGREASYQAKVGRDQLVNTVAATFVDPSQLWESASAPLRRSQADIIADGEARETTLALRYVTSQTQAQRIAEIHRRKSRNQGQANVPLGPKFMLLECGDWGTWTSDRHFGGEARTFVVVAAAHDENGATQLGLRQIDAAAFGWNAAVDELAHDAPAYLPPGAAPPAQINDFEAEPLEIPSPGGTSAGAIRATWTPPADQTIRFVRLEYRPAGSLASISVNVDPRAGEYIISVLPVADIDYEIRAVPETVPRRDVLATAWREVLLSAPFTLPEPPASFVGYQNRDLIRFVIDAFADTTLRYEIRNGVTFDLGRLVDNFAGGATTVQWPIGSAEDALFWCKTVHRSGLYSTEAKLWVATVADVGDRNFILGKDFADEDFPGTLHAMTRDEIDEIGVLTLDRAGGFSVSRGDYYEDVSLLSSFYARSWIEQRVNSIINDTPTWDEVEASWDEAGDADWDPDIGAPGSANLQSFIAVDADEPVSTLIEAFRFNGSLEGWVDETTPFFSIDLEYAPGRTADGVHVDGGALFYELAFTAAFSLLIDARIVTAPEDDASILTLSNADNDWLQLQWRADDGAFVLEGSDGVEVAIVCPCAEDDTLSIGIWQSATARGLVIGSRALTADFSGTGEIEATPIFETLSVGGPSGEGALWDDVEETWDENDESWAQLTTLGPSIAGVDAVFTDLELHDTATQGAGFTARWQVRGPVGFEDYVPFLAGEFEFMTASIWMRLSSPEPLLESLSITLAKLNVDVPDVVDKGDDVAIAEGGSWISFNRAFYAAPSVVCTQRSGDQVAFVEVDAIEADRFHVTFYTDNSRVTSIAGTASYAAVGF